MGKTNIKVFLFLFLCSGSLFMFSQLGPLAYNQVFGEPRTYEADTMVGPLHIGGLTKTEVRQKLAEEASKWKETHQVTLKMKDQNVVFQQDFIQFDITETLNHVQDGNQSFFSVGMNNSYFGAMQEKVGSDLYNHILIDKLSDKIVSRAKSLHPEQLNFSIYQYVEDGTSELYEVVSEYQVEVLSESGINSLIEDMNGALIQNQSPFSLLSFVEKDRGTQPSLNRVATGLYGAVLNTNFMVNQRHISTKLPSYAELGKEASVKPEHNHDLVFTNPNEQTYQLNMEVESGQLRVQILGYPLPNEYELSIESKRTIQPRTIVQFSELVQPGDTSLKEEGREGTFVEVYRFEKNNETVVQKDFVSEDYYPPVNRVEVQYGSNDQPPETDPNQGRNPSGSNSPFDEQAPGVDEEQPEGSSSDSPSSGDEANQPSPGSGETEHPEDVWEGPDGNPKSEDK